MAWCGRPRAMGGTASDLDSVAVLRDVLCSVKSAARGLHLINERFLAPSRVLGLDDEWRDANGPRDRGAAVGELREGVPTYLPRR